MAQDLYVTGAEQGSGKSVIVLAMMEYFSGNTGKAGIFRPVTRSDEQHDQLIHLITQRYRIDSPYEDLYGCSSDVARRLIAEDRYDELLKQILGKYRRLQEKYDRVLCVGTDYSHAYATLEFDFNTDVANNLGCLIMPVVRGIGRSNAEIRDATAGFLKSVQERNCDVLATVINGVARSQFDELKTQFAHTPGTAPVYLVPEEPALSRPTVGDITRSLGARVIYGDTDNLNREITHYTVAAMQVPDFLDHLEAGGLVITPGDRADIILACLMAYPSTACPQISGLLLSGGLQPAPQLVKLLAGLGKPPFAVLGTDGDTFTTAMQVNRVSSTLTAENEHKIAAALGLVEAHIALPELERMLASERDTRVTPLMFEYELAQRARKNIQHIVLPEGSEERILRAAEILTLRGVVRLTLLGDSAEIQQKIQALGLHLDGVDIIDPLNSELRERYADTYYTLRQHKGISREMAFDTMADVSYFGTMMVHHGQADGMVSGAVHTTQHTIRPAFEIIKTRPGTAIVSSVFFMCLEDRVLVYGDCAVNPDPDARQLADIAVSSADTAHQFGVEPRVAMLSYSTGASGKGAAVDKVREATQLARELRPDVMIEGPIQYDAAIDAGVASTKLPESPVAGNATVFIFPDLNTGNNTYKAVQRSADAIAIGPVLQGLNKPVNDLSRGCTVTDIVNTVVITAVQAQAGDAP
ncbi:MAG TPA: phosphate acetyltransferase [Gammaproteobacteria bacterium]|nr:phosphate acetyltransferase [Gammaproteobacteria bacterium]